MDMFINNIASFPTAIYTVLLGVLVCYWLSAIVGLVDLDILNMDGLDINADNGGNDVNALAGLMIRMGMTGVPAIISLSLALLFGWLLCYYIVHYLLLPLSAIWLRYLFGIPVLLLTFYLGMLITSYLIRPLRGLFKTAIYETTQHMLGQSVVVRTSRVDNEFGEAVLNNGGADMIVKIRSVDDERFKQGDRVVLFEKIGDGSLYRVMSEAEFGKV